MLYIAFMLLSLVVLVALFYQVKARSFQKRCAESRKAWVKSLRLNKMLEHLGASLDAYVKHVPTLDIERHIQRCQGCKNLRQCDACLRDRRYVADMHFCPNYDSLLQFGRRIAK
jgi:hypothetical protein